MALSDLFGGVANLFKNAVSEDEQDNTPNTQDSEPQYTTNSSFSFKGNPASFQVNERPFRGADLIRPAEFHDQSPAIRQLFDFDIRTGGDPAVNLADFQAKMRDSVVRSFELEQAQIRDVTQKINDNQQTIVSELQKFSERYSALERTFGDANERIRYLESNLEQTQYTLSRQKETSTKKRSYGNPVRKSANAITNALESFGQILMGGAIATYLGKQVFDWVQSPEGWKEFKDQIWPKILSDVLEPLNQNMAERFRASRDELLNTIKNDIAPVVGRWIEDNPGKFAAAVALATKNPIAGAGAYTAGKLYGFYDFYANDKQDDPEYRKKTAQDIEALKRTTEKWGRENHIDLSKGLHSTENFVSPHGYGGGIVRGPSDYSSFGDMGNQMMLNLQGGFSATENFVSPHGYGGGAQRSSSDASVSSGQGDSSGGKQAPQTNDVGQIKPQSYLAPQDNDMGVYDDRSSWQKFYDWVFGAGSPSTGSGKFGPGWGSGFGGGFGGGGAGGDYTPSGPTRVMPKISALQALLEPPTANATDPFRAYKRAGLATGFDQLPASEQAFIFHALKAEGDVPKNLEQLSNYAEARGMSLDQAIHSGFFGPVNRGAVSRRPLSPQEQEQWNNAIKDWRAGSNIIGDRTDQGMRGDPNYALEHSSDKYRPMGAFADHPMFDNYKRTGKSWYENRMEEEAQFKQDHPELYRPKKDGAITSGIQAMSVIEGENGSITKIEQQTRRANELIADIETKRLGSQLPQKILNQAREVAKLGPAQLQQFMAQNGYPQSGAWCGEFAAAMVKSVGGNPPANPAIASNWRNWGPRDQQPHVGDVAVRKGVPTGSSGSHVGFVTNVGEGVFGLTGGNQGRPTAYEMKRQTDQYDFFKPPVSIPSTASTSVDQTKTQSPITKMPAIPNIAGPPNLDDVKANVPKGPLAEPTLPKETTKAPDPKLPPEPQKGGKFGPGWHGFTSPQNADSVKPKTPPPKADDPKAAGGGVRGDSGTKSSDNGSIRNPKSNWETQGASAGDPIGTGSNLDNCCYI